MEVSSARLRQLVESYEYIIPEHEEYAAGRPLPTLSLKDEFFCLIERLDKTKFPAVHPLLVGFDS